MYAFIHTHGKWIRILAYSALVLAGIYTGAYASLYRLSEHTTLQLEAQAALQGKNRTVRFDERIDRRLFPRPTVTLYRAELSEAGGDRTAFEAEEIRIGMAWKSLWDEPEVEKLTLENVRADININDEGVWDIADLFQPAARPSPRFNRVNIRNGTLTLRENGRRWQLGAVDFTMTRADAENQPYTLSARLEEQDLRLDISAAGTVGWDGKTFSLPDLAADFSGEEHSYGFSGSLKSSLRFAGGTPAADKTTLTLNSKRYDSSLNLSADAAAWQNGRATIGNLNAVFTAAEGSRRYNGTLTSPKVSGSGKVWGSDETVFNLNTEAPGQDPLSLKLDGSAQWRDGTLSVPEFKLISQQNGADGRQRFVSEWEGSLKLPASGNWQFKAQGLFDRQPAKIEFSRSGDDISGSANLAKLNAAPYLDLLQSETAASPYPEWHDRKLKLKVDLALGMLELPGLNVENIAATLNADAEEARFDPLSAELYSGRTSGSLTVRNTVPTEYRLKQNAENVELLPMLQDLLRYSAISGKGRAIFDLSAKGSGRRELLASLSGSLKFDVADGQWLGINLRALAQGLLDKKGGGPTVHTPFSRFELESTIENGISRNTVKARLTDPAVDMSGSGETNLAEGTVSESILLHNGEGTPPLPVRISGTLDKPTVSLDYQQITAGITDPEAKKKAVQDALSGQWQWLKRQK